MERLKIRQLGNPLLTLFRISVSRNKRPEAYFYLIVCIFSKEYTMNTLSSTNGKNLYKKLMIKHIYKKKFNIKMY